MKRSTRNPKPLPDASYLRECLEYRADGTLHWLWRSELHFKSKRSYATWNATYAGKRAGSPMKNGYRLISLDEVKFLEHRIIYAIEHGTIPNGCSIDHIDHNHRNNCIENLRACSHAENLWNQPPRGRTHNGIVLPTHVVWNKLEKKYKVEVRVKNRRVFVGTFALLDDAARAATEAAAKLRGEFVYRGEQ